MGIERRCKYCGSEEVHGRRGRPVCEACRKAKETTRKQRDRMFAKRYHQSVQAQYEGVLGKICRACGVDKPLSAYRSKKSWKCFDCQFKEGQERQKRWLLKRWQRRSKRCEICDELVPWGRGRSQYCSPKCSAQAYQQARQGQRKRGLAKLKSDPGRYAQALERQRLRRKEWVSTGHEAERSARRRESVAVRLSGHITSSMNGALHGKKNGRKWESLVGYTLADLMRHLERLFLPGMNWDNYGRRGWNVDHIIPRTAFNYTSPEDEDFKRCWALSNLQPLWEADNIRKSNKLMTAFQPALALGA